MISFREFKFIDEAVNAHMTHIQDLVFLDGVNGTRTAINFLRDVRDMLRNDGAKTPSKISIKFDGAPAVICGIDPVDGEFFVAKKGVFNKNPKVYKTQQDIDADLSGELHDKFSILLPELKKLNIKGIIQGDLMFTEADKTVSTIHGEQYITFHPNTILYAVPLDSELGHKIKKAKIGIVFHTKYTGSDFANLNASFGEKLTTGFSNNPNVWAIDATYEDQTGRANFTTKESQMVDKKLSAIGKLFQSLNSSIVNHIQKDSELQSLVLIYINSRVRTNAKKESGIKIAAGFLQFIADRYQKEIDTKKSQKGKDVSEEKRIRVMQYLKQVSLSDLGLIFDLSYMLDDVKNDIVGVLNRASNINTFLKTSNGFRVTSQEGFVAINSDGNAIKLVDRAEFSLANFGGVGTEKILRGWEK